ncbi:MAG TPA: FG-GAP-like repeat-containing protein [Fimbriiglobus sp.]|jgi:hypothetical protein
MVAISKFRPMQLDRLEDRTTPSTFRQMFTAPIVHPHRFAVGSGPGATAQVNVYDAETNAILTTVTPFGRGYTGGVRVATADFTGDGVDDLAVVAASGSSRVVVYNGATGRPIADFYAFSQTFTGGAFIAAGDVTGDGRADLVLGMGVGGHPQVKVFRGQDLLGSNPTMTDTFFAGDATLTTGVRVAVGDATHDGVADVLTSAGPTAAVFTHRTVSATVTRFDVATVPNIPPNASMAVGDYNGDGYADTVYGFVQNGRAEVKVVSGKDGRTLLTAFGFSAGPDGTVPVAAKDLNGDGKAEIIVGGGSGTSQVRILGGDTGGLFRSFMAFTPNYTGGVYVG